MLNAKAVPLQSEEPLLELTRAAARGAAYNMRRRYYGSWYYGWRLKGPVPDRVRFSPEISFEPDPEAADRFLQGQYVLPGGQVRITTGTPWEVRGPNRQWAEALHSFDWLSHFEARKGDDVSRHARWLVTTWLNTHRRCKGVAWEPHVIARRLISWMTNWDLIVSGSDMIWRSSVLRHMERQARHLRRTVKMAPAGDDRFDAIYGLAMSGAALPDAKRRLERGLALLDRELSVQVLADGGPVTRAPEALLEMLLRLLDLRDALMKSGEHVPERLSQVIDRIAPAVDFFRMGDGRLALFNGGTEGAENAIHKALAGGMLSGSPLTHLPYSGFHRISAKKTLVLVDAGAPPASPYNTHVHAGTLSFEMSVGKHRMITNCGSISWRGADWEQAVRATSAHSTLSINGASSAEFQEGGMAGHFFGPRLTNGPETVDVSRHEKEGGLWVDLSQDGYLERYGVIHQRRLFMTADGNDFRGEDRLTEVEAEEDRLEPIEGVVVRFHVHPDVKVSLARDKSNVLLVLPNRVGWQFRAAGGNISLEDSIYIGDGRNVKRTHQIVVTADRPSLATKINWALRKLEEEKTA